MFRTRYLISEANKCGRKDCEHGIRQPDGIYDAADCAEYIKEELERLGHCPRPRLGDI